MSTGNSALWIPTSDALPITHRPSDGAGAFTGTPHWKLLLHTTEGGTLQSNSDLLVREGYEPHFVIDVHKRSAVQLLALNEIGKALEHPAGTPITNGAHAIQVECVGFSELSTARADGYTGNAAVVDWEDFAYYSLALLARSIQRRCAFRNELRAFAHPKRFGAQEFVNWSGVCGHCHVPNNSHTDPGVHFKGTVLMGKIEHGPAWKA